MTTIKKITIGAFSALGVFAMSVSISGQTHSPFKLGDASSESYHTVWDNNDVVSSLTDAYQKNVTGSVETDLGNSVQLNFIAAKNASDAFVQLAPSGMIHNFSSGDNPVHGVSAVKVTFSGSLTYSAARASDGSKAILQKPITLTSGSKVSVPSADYFKFYAGDNGATISSLELFYGCETDNLDVRLLDGTFTGTGNDGYRYKITANNGSANIVSLNKPSNISYSGTVEWLSASQARFSFNSGSDTLTENVDSYRHGLTYVSKTGSNLPQVSLARVYDLEDFESFSATGNGFTSTRGADSVYSMSGLRRAVYADYYGSNTVESPIGGSGWSLMGSSDFLNYSSNKGIDGSKAAILKGNSNKLRYIFGFNSYFGVPEVIGMGTTISFWTSGAYSNSSCTTAGAASTIKFYAWRVDALTPSSVGESNREQASISIPAGSGGAGKQYTLTLNSSAAYYAFGFYLETSSTIYMPIDNIKIYTTSPFDPVPVTGVTVSPSTDTVHIGDQTQLSATVAPANADNQAVNWSSSNTSVATVDSNGLVAGVAAGNATITATTVDGGFTSSCTVTVALSNYPEGTFSASVTINSTSTTLVLAIGNATNGLVAVRANNNTITTTGISMSGTNFTISTSGNYPSTSYTVGTITGTFNPSTNTLSSVKFNGTIKNKVTNNGSITMSRPSHIWECDGTTAQLQSTFKRRYMSGSWQVDTGNADRITSNTTEFVSGTGSVKRRGYSGGAVALNFGSDFSPAITVKAVQFWVYNPSGSDISLRMWGYKATNFGSNFETSQVTAKASQWTYVAMGFTSASIYNFQIADFNNTGTYLSFDNIMFY